MNARTESMTTAQLFLVHKAQARGGALCGPECGWIKRNDGSRYIRTGWFLAHVWTPRGGSGWRGRVDTMIAQYDPARTRSAESYVIQAEGGFGPTREFATPEEATAYCEQTMRIA